MQRLLTAEQDRILRQERTLLESLQVTLARLDAPDSDLDLLRQSLHQLEEMFLLVVVGEFNAGKSAVINALLGDRYLTEGVVPTTSQLHILRYGEQLTQTVDPNGAFFDDVVDRIAARAEGVTADPAVGQLVRDEAQKRLDLWFKLQQRQAVSLVYSKPKDAQLPLLVIPEAGGWSLQTAPNSLRETEAPVNLLVVTEDASMASGMPGFSLGAGQAPSAPAIVTAEDDEAEVAE